MFFFLLIYYRNVKKLWMKICSSDKEMLQWKWLCNFHYGGVDGSYQKNSVIILLTYPYRTVFAKNTSHTITYVFVRDLFVLVSVDRFALGLRLFSNHVRYAHAQSGGVGEIAVCVSHTLKPALLRMLTQICAVNVLLELIAERYLSLFNAWPCTSVRYCFTEPGAFKLFYNQLATYRVDCTQLRAIRFYV